MPTLGKFIMNWIILSSENGVLGVKRGSQQILFPRWSLGCVRVAKTASISVSPGSSMAPQHGAFFLPGTRAPWLLSPASSLCTLISPSLHSYCSLGSLLPRPSHREELCGWISVVTVQSLTNYVQVLVCFLSTLPLGWYFHDWQFMIGSSSPSKQLSAKGYVSRLNRYTTGDIRIKQDENPGYKIFIFSTVG